MKNTLTFVIALSAVFTLAPLAIDMYLPALPAMAASLGGSIDEIEASVAIFLLGYAFSQLVFGPLSDRFGRKPVLLGGLVLFAAGSALCAIAANPEQLYLFRFLQAVGGGASVTVFALVKDNFDEQGSARIISYIMSVVVIAPMIAPIIGGYLLVWSGWQSIFLLLAGLSVLTLAGVVLSINEKTESKAPIGAFQMTQLLKAYHRVLSNRRSVLHMLTGAFAFAGLFAFVAGSPFVYIEYFSIAPQHYGFLVGLNAVAMIVMNLINAQVLNKKPPTGKMIVGVIAIAGAALGLLIADRLALGLWPIVTLVVIFVGMLGLVSANAVAGALSEFNEEAGTASALYGVFQFGFGAVSSAVVSGWESRNATPMVTVMAICGFLALASALPLITRSVNHKSRGEKQ